MKKLLFFLLLFITKVAFAQKALDEMIAAEKSFAAYSVANNTKDAFLKFMDTSAIMFKNGEPYKSYDVWLKREKSPGVLNWWPRFAEIAASGDFGYTCGPWTFQPQTANDSVVASGYFFTIWKKNTAGEWKFILDVGTDSGPMLTDTGFIENNPSKTAGAQESLLSAEQEYIQLSTGDLNNAYLKFLRGNTIMCKEANDLRWVKLPWHPAPKILDESIYSVKGNGISSTGDLGYVYGTIELKGKKETYIRFWRHQPKGWKLALQMTRL